VITWIVVVVVVVVVIIIIIIIIIDPEGRVKCWFLSSIWNVPPFV